jgi:hypothetical protein
MRINWGSALLSYLIFSFPAATTTVTPALVRAAMAELSAVDLDPPIEIFVTAFPARPLAVTFVATSGC